MEREAELLGAKCLRPVSVCGAFLRQPLAAMRGGWVALAR
jgi:hypothetical protein